MLHNKRTVLNPLHNKGRRVSMDKHEAAPYGLPLPVAAIGAA